MPVYNKIIFSKIGCQGYSDETNLVREGTSGVIQSPNYPHGFAHYIYCFWHVHGPTDRRVKVEFDDFDMGEHRSYVWNGTTYYYCRDSVSVRLLYLCYYHRLKKLFSLYLAYIMKVTLCLFSYIVARKGNGHLQVRIIQCAAPKKT